MRDAIVTLPPPDINNSSHPEAAPDRVSAAVAGSIQELPESRVDFGQLAAVPVWGPSLEGGTARIGARHIAGGARITRNRARKEATVALADGTRITFGALKEVSDLELV